MTVRSIRPDELERALEIYSRARTFMKESGNPTQWGQTYPPESLVAEDIARGVLYGVCDGDGIYAIFAFFPAGDPIYNNIDGKWLNDLPHAAIHRVASSGERRGMLRECIDYCLSRSKNLKIDTHADNSVMQSALKKLGFNECGTVALENGESRIAFQLYRE